MEVVQLKKHISRRTKDIQFIVIHDTGNPSAGAGAAAHKKYFLTTERKASADFIVENNTIIKLNNYYKYFTWHCGDGKGKYGITNSNSIGIEMCINPEADRQKTINTTIKLVYDLMKELNVRHTRIVRHYDASRKRCPGSMAANNWADWWRFKDALREYKAERQDKGTYIVIEYKDERTLMETIKKNDYNYVKIRDLAKLLNKDITYDAEKITLLDK